MSTTPERYPLERIFAGIERVFRDEIGVGIPIRPDQRIDKYLGSFWAEIDLSDVFDLLEIQFGFHSTRWEELIGYHLARDPNAWEREFGPQFTFQTFAEFIQQEIPVVPLAPINMLGAPCLTAGVFRGLEDVARQIRPEVTRFGPSTPIRDRIDGPQLERFWGRLQFMTEYRLPSLRNPLQNLFVGCIFLAFLAFLCGRAFDTFLLSWLCVIGLATAFLAYGVIRPSPLPGGIVTFADLARVVAHQTPRA